MVPMLYFGYRSKCSTELDHYMPSVDIFRNEIVFEIIISSSIKNTKYSWFIAKNKLEEY